MALKGKRIVYASETGEGQAFNIRRIKELTGGDTLNAREPYAKRPVEFIPTHLLILLTNDRPKVPGDDDASWERIHLIPFNVRFVDNPVSPNEHKADHDLLEKLKKEASGILAWLLRGCIEFQRLGGLHPPEIVKVATSEYRKESDELRQFMDDDIVRRLGNVDIRTSELYELYCKWNLETGLTEKVLSMRRFVPRLVTMGYERDDSGRYPLFKLKGIV